MVALTQNAPRVAVEYASALRDENAAAVAAMLRQWRRVRGDLDADFLRTAPQLIEIANTAQLRVSRLAQEFIPEVLEATGQARANRPAWDIAENVFVGTAGDGRPTETLIYGALTTTKTAIGEGATYGQALERGGKFLSLATGTLLSDTSRGMEGFESASRPVSGWVRMLTPPSCGRCVILAGRHFKRNRGFERHPGCFPAGAVVSGPAPEAATRRWYEGELAIVRTASGKKLTATANHPVLTDEGWVPAGLLNKGDGVLASTSSDGAVPLVVPDEKQAPALIEDVWGADDMVPLGAVPTAAEDFHGDGGHGDVDVVLPNRLLGHGAHSGGFEGVVDGPLAAGLNPSAALTTLGAVDQLVPGEADPGSGAMRGGGLSLALLGRHLRGAGLSGGGASPNVATGLKDATPDDVTADAVALGEFILADSGLVLPRDGVDIQDEVSPRWDAPAGPLTMETRGAYASRGQDLGLRLAGQVEVDRVIDVSLVKWSGHVYNLTSSEGWYAADGFIVSNCDCRHIPASESVAGDLGVNADAYLNSLDDAALAKALGSQDNARAFREFGADSRQLVNAYRKGGGIRTAQVYGRNVRYTLEGTTRRGVAYHQMSRVRALSAMGEVKDGRYRRLTAPRLMPESIFQIATSKPHAERLLRDHGWLGYTP